MFEILTSIFTGGGSTILGAVFGKLFHWLEIKEETKRRAQDQAHELASKSMDLKIAQQEGDNAVRLAETEAAGKQGVADAEAFGKSYDLEPPSFAATVGAPKKGVLHSIGWFMLVILDTLRGAIRPVLTIYLTLTASEMMYRASEVVSKIQPGIHDQIALDTYTMTVSALLEMFKFSVGWYFGTRPGKK